MYERRLPIPRADADHYAAAIYERLGELLSAVGELAELVRARTVGGTSGPAQPIEEPAAQPERAPARGTSDEPPGARPGPVERPSPPPRAGKGSGLTAWQAFADNPNIQVAYQADATRDDIIAACEKAGVIEPKEA